VRGAPACSLLQLRFDLNEVDPFLNLCLESLYHDAVVMLVRCETVLELLDFFPFLSQAPSPLVDGGQTSERTFCLSSKVNQLLFRQLTHFFIGVGEYLFLHTSEPTFRLRQLLACFH
jgi:hypothetical protein